MKQYIDKSALLTEMERRILEDYNTGDGEKDAVAQGAIISLKYYIEDTLEVYEVVEEEDDLEEVPKQYALNNSPWEDCVPEVQDAFKAGAQWQKERILNNATEREVKVDVCGYPYIDFTELYDYDKDIPLAKEGDKVKLVIIRENNL